LLTPTLSDALADSVIVPLVPDSLAVTVGGVVSVDAVPWVTHIGADHRRNPLAWVTSA